MGKIKTTGWPNRDVGGDEIVEALRGSPEVASFIEKREHKIAEERQAAAAQLAKLRDDGGAEFQRLTAEIDQALNEYRKAEAALQAAAQKYHGAVNARGAASYRLTAEIDAHERTLIASASPLIAEFIAEMRNEHTRALRAKNIIDDETAKNPNTGAIVGTRRARGATAAQRARAIRDAIAAAEALRLDADQSGIAQQLAKLRAELPIVGTEPTEALRK